MQRVGVAETSNQGITYKLSCRPNEQQDICTPVPSSSVLPYTAPVTTHSDTHLLHRGCSGPSSCCLAHLIWEEGVGLACLAELDRDILGVDANLPTRIKDTVSGSAESVTHLQRSCRGMM
jgi:hypothetical protein